MKRICISFLAVLLSALVLLGGGQFTIGRMVCLGDGHASYSLGKAKDCCETNGAPQESLKTSCCDLTNVSFSLDDYNPSNKVHVYALGFDFFHLPFSILHLPLNIFSSGEIVAIADIPPPDIKDRLYSFGSLLL